LVGNVFSSSQTSEIQKSPWKRILLFLSLSVEL